MKTIFHLLESHRKLFLILAFLRIASNIKLISSFFLKIEWFDHSSIRNRSQSICRIVSVYRVLQMQGGGHADVLMYFKCPPTQQVQCPVNAYLYSMFCQQIITEILNTPGRIFRAHCEMVNRFA